MGLGVSLCVLGVLVSWAAVGARSVVASSVKVQRTPATAAMDSDSVEQSTAGQWRDVDVPGAVWEWVGGRPRVGGTSQGILGRSDCPAARALEAQAFL